MNGSLRPKATVAVQLHISLAILGRVIAGRSVPA
jgi:hypothetical protein